MSPIGVSMLIALRLSLMRAQGYIMLIVFVCVCVCVCLNLHRLRDRLSHNLHIKEVNSLYIEEVEADFFFSNRTTRRGVFTLYKLDLKYFWRKQLKICGV